MTAERAAETRYLLNPATHVAHDTWYLSEQCNTDDIAYPFAKPALPAGYTLCAHCVERQEAIDAAREQPTAARGRATPAAPTPAAEPAPDAPGLQS